MTPNPFDQACRYLCKKYHPALLAWVMRLSPGDFVFRRWLDTRSLSYPGQPDRTCDTVAHLEDVRQGQKPWAVIAEFQITPDELMLGRFMGYAGPLWIEHKPSPERGDRFEIGIVVVNLTGRGNMARDMSWPNVGLRTAIQPVERNLEFEPAAELLADIGSGKAPRAALPFVPLMQGGSEADIIGKWVELASGEPDAGARADFGGLALIFAEAGKCREPWRESLRGWNVVQSQQVLEWQSAAREQGMAAGQQQGRIRSIQRVLTNRFGPVAAELSARLDALPQAANLDAILDAATLAPSLDVFRAELVRIQGQS